MPKAVIIATFALFVFFAVFQAGILIAAPVDLKTMLASPLDSTVYRPDRRMMPGHAHYTIKDLGNGVDIVGKEHYGNGERDMQHVILAYQAGNPLPVVTSFQADFMAANGSPQLLIKADFKSGQASCRWSNELDDNAYEDKLKFEPDTYAGAASIIPLEYALKKGQSTLRFHVFDCAPKPKVFTVDAKRENGKARWSYYPGDLTKMSLTPDLGWLNAVAKPFIPEISVWFSPSEDHQWVGTTKHRFYRGERIVLVRSGNGHSISGAESAQPPVEPPAPSSNHGKSVN